MRLRLIHWHAGEAEERAATLQAAGYEVDSEPLDGAALRMLRAEPPAAVVIDLGRMPSQGRDLALVIRKYKTTRHLPLIMVGGEVEKVARIRELVPDGVYTTWGRIRSAVKRAIARPPVDPVVPASSFAAYAGTPLPRKLGIKADYVVGLVGAPDDFADTLGVLPTGAKLRWQARGRCDLIVWFAKSRREVERRVARLGELAGPGGLWIAWPRRASGVASDLTQSIVREIGLAAGLVDYKVSAIDSTWSGLRFTRRRKR